MSIKEFILKGNDTYYGVCFIKMKRTAYAGYDYSITFFFYKHNCEILFQRNIQHNCKYD